VQKLIRKCGEGGRESERDGGRTVPRGNENHKVCGWSSIEENDGAMLTSKRAQKANTKMKLQCHTRKIAQEQEKRRQAHTHSCILRFLVALYIAFVL
jgi:hypothetical protein